MNTIAPHLAVATILVAGHIGHARASGRRPGSPPDNRGDHPVGPGPGRGRTGRRGLGRRGLAVLLSEFVRLAAAMMSTLFIMAIAAVAVVALLLHR